jgi:hypothetical protein
MTPYDLGKAAFTYRLNKDKAPLTFPAGKSLTI